MGLVKNALLTPDTVTQGRINKQGGDAVRDMSGRQLSNFAPASTNVGALYVPEEHGKTPNMIS